MKKFIVIDGFDGSGKDSQSKFIFEMYKNKLSKDNETIEEKVVFRSNPETDNYFGIISHKSLLKDGKIHKIIATVFFAFDIFRSLILYYHRSDVLIFSRYLLASAYFPKKMVKPVYKFFSFILPTSEYMFYLDLSPEIAMERITSRNVSIDQEFQIFENQKALMKSRKKADLISSNWIKIDGSKSKEEIKDEIQNILLNNSYNRECKSYYFNK